MFNLKELFLNTQGMYLHLFCVLFQMANDFITIQLYKKVTTNYMKNNGLDVYVWYWLECIVVDHLMYATVQCTASWHFEVNFVLEFRTKALKEYAKLNHATKTKEPLVKYNRKLDNALNLFTMAIGWGSFVIMNSFSSMMEVWLYFSDYVHVRNAIMAIIAVSFYIILYYNRKVSSIQKECRKKKEKIQNHITITESYFELGKKDYYSIVSLLRDKFFVNLPMRELKDKKQMFVFTHELTLNIIVLLVCIYGGKSVNAINLLHVIVKLGNNIRAASHFLSAVSENVEEWDKFVDFWKENEKNQIAPPIQQPFPDEINISSVDFKRDNYQLHCDQPLKLSQGSVFMLKGDTAVGKSTFCDLLQGKDVLLDDADSGIKFEEGPVRSFTHHICECSQECSARVKWDISTVRDHFNDETDDELIYHFCEITCIVDKVKELGLDEEISREVSGGEQQRITLASNLYFAHVNKSRIIIFDEPEKGLGKLSTTVIQRIIDMKENRNNIIVISSHDL